MPKKLETGRFFAKKFDGNKKISMPKRREIKRRKRYFYVLKKNEPPNSSTDGKPRLSLLARRSEGN